MKKRAQLLIYLLFPFLNLLAQKASLTFESIKTYPFSDPNPIPVLGINKKVAPFYPYFTYDGYTNNSVKKDWKVVKLENSLVIVYILPGVGGKVMGAVEKATGNEFVYLNHVMKFRAIGIRGPWTSGGIEHNFGLDLGHAPWAAADVDYVIVTNPDSSVSCIVGGLDLASRSEWRVNIRLPKDKAYFETESFWYNPSPLHHAYLSWENAAFKATNDLQFYFPGNYHIGHDGLSSPWPTDNTGRDLSLYKNNNFGDSKSYHVVGNYRNWFGGYWKDKNFGFGHWAPYADAPGKKLWIWSLSREGAIWENLLTDNDGQYIEAQSGVTLNQAAERSGFHSPFRQLSLRPLYAETKKEYWFPVKNTGGMADATPYGTLNVTTAKDSVSISISPNQAINDSLIVRSNNQTIYAAYLQLKPLQVYQKTIPVASLQNIRIRVGNDKLLYTSDKQETQVARPVIAPATDLQYSSASRFFRMGEDENSMRNYDLALSYYQQCLQGEPTNSEALCRVAEYYYRSAQYEKGIDYAIKALAYNTYDAGANYIYGNLLNKLGRLTQAEEAFSMATRLIEYRSAALTALANINIQKKDFDAAIANASQSLDYNRNNLLAYQYLATSYRHINETNKADSILSALLQVDPLNHYAHFEQYFLTQTPAALVAFKSAITNELPHETYLELATTYANEGLTEEAVKVLEQAPEYPTIYYWLAYLKKDVAPAESKVLLQKAEAISPRFVFPFRIEEISVLEWAKAQHESWKTTYYLGLVFWNNLRTDKAKEFFKECGETPDFATFYLARAALFLGDSSSKMYVSKNYKKALQLEPEEWRTWHYQSTYLLNAGSFQQSLVIAKQAYYKFASNPIIAMDYAKTLLYTGGLETCLQVLKKVLVLPQEGAQEGHEMYEMANLALAVKLIDQNKYQPALKYINDSKLWPENLGTGSPYNPDNRLQNLLAAYCFKKLNNQKNADDLYNQITSYSAEIENWNNARNASNNYISALVLSQQSRKPEAEKLMGQWKANQDSLSNWNLLQGSAAPEFKWVFAKYNNDTEGAATLEKELLVAGTESRFRIVLKALQDVSK